MRFGGFQGDEADMGIELVQAPIGFHAQVSLRNPSRPE